MRKGNLGSQLLERQKYLSDCGGSRVLIRVCNCACGAQSTNDIDYSGRANDKSALGSTTMLCVFLSGSSLRKREPNITKASLIS
jgi:hypothetical protein